MHTPIIGVKFKISLTSSFRFIDPKQYNIIHHRSKICTHLQTNVSANVAATLEDILMHYASKSEYVHSVTLYEYDF